MELLLVFPGNSFDSARCGGIRGPGGGVPSLDAISYRYGTAQNGSQYDADASMCKVLVKHWHCNWSACVPYHYRNRFSCWFLPTFTAYLFARCIEGRKRQLVQNFYRIIRIGFSISSTVFFSLGGATAVPGNS